MTLGQWIVLAYAASILAACSAALIWERWVITSRAIDRDIDRALEEPRDDRQVATRLDGGWL